MLNSFKSRLLLLILINAFIFTGIYIFYKPKIPINDHIIVSTTLRTEYDSFTQKNNHYLMGYIKSFSPKKLYDVSVHIEYKSLDKVVIVSKQIGVINSGDIKTYIIKIDDEKAIITKEWATFSYTQL